LATAVSAFVHSSSTPDPPLCRRDTPARRVFDRAATFRREVTVPRRGFHRPFTPRLQGLDVHTITRKRALRRDACYPQRHRARVVVTRKTPESANEFALHMTRGSLCSETVHSAGDE
jgi:hypothetical protein